MTRYLRVYGKFLVLHFNALLSSDGGETDQKCMEPGSESAMYIICDVKVKMLGTPMAV